MKLQQNATAAGAHQTANQPGYTVSKLDSSFSPIWISCFHSSLLSPISTHIRSYISLCYLTRLLNAATSLLLFHSNVSATSPLPSLLSLLLPGVVQSTTFVSSIASLSSLFDSSRLSPIRRSLVNLRVRLSLVQFNARSFIVSTLRMSESITEHLPGRLVLTIHPKRMMAVSLKSLETHSIKKPEESETNCTRSSAFFRSPFRAFSMLSFLLLFILIRNCK